MSILGPEAAAFVQSESERAQPLFGKYITKVPARVVSISGTAPNQKAVVATPDQIAALASGEITEIPRPAMPVYGSVVVDQWVWCLADAAGLHVMGTPSGEEVEGIPSGGTSKQVLRKSGNGNYEVEWATLVDGWEEQRAGKGGRVIFTSLSAFFVTQFKNTAQDWVPFVDGVNEMSVRFKGSTVTVTNNSKSTRWIRFKQII